MPCSPFSKTFPSFIVSRHPLQPMSTLTKHRLPLLLALSVMVLGLSGYAAWRSATQFVRTRVEQALGPGGALGEVRLGLSGLEILDLRLRANKDAGCPEEDELRAHRIHALPDYFDLLGGRLTIETLEIEGAHLVVWRAPDGKIQLVPGLRERKTDTPPSSETAQGGKAIAAEKRSIDIGRILVSDSTLAFYDRGRGATPIHLRVEGIKASVGRLSLPQAAGPIPLKLDGTIKGSRREGRLEVEGTVDPATRDARLSARLRDLALSTLQAYVLKPGEPGIDGRLDLDIRPSLVGGNTLRVPGSLTLSDLELGGSGTFLGLPRKAVSALLKARKGKITVKFVVSGELDDPHFSVEEQMTKRLATSLRQARGMDVRGLAESIDSGDGDAAKAITDAIGQKLERQRNKRRQ